MGRGVHKTEVKIPQKLCRLAFDGRIEVLFLDIRANPSAARHLRDILALSGSRHMPGSSQWVKQICDSLLHSKYLKVDDWKRINEEFSVRPDFVWMTPKHSKNPASDTPEREMEKDYCASHVAHTDSDWSTSITSYQNDSPALL